MSQSGVLTVKSGGGSTAETLTGNSGGAVSPDALFNIDLLGNNTSGINVVGNPGTNTLTIIGIQATTSQRGTVFLATNAEAIAGTDTFDAITSAALAAKLGTQTAHSLAVFEGTASALTALGVAGNGQLPIGSIGADPVLGNITSTGGTITVTNGPGTINLDIAGGHSAIEQFLPNSGTTPVVPNGTGQVTMTGSGSTTTVGGLNTLTFQLTGLTNHAVQVGAGTATLTQLAVGTNGQVLIGATTADPAFATLTSSDSSISFTTGVNTLSLQVAGGTTTIKTITGNSGGAESPSAGNFNILGTGSITVVGSANTETVQLTGLTNHAIQIGAGTATLTQLGAGTTGQVLQTNTGADPTWSTATYPSTTTINQILYSSAANTVGGLATANQGVLTTGATGTPVITALATNGQLIIGSTAGVPAAATLTPGAGISITNGSNSITIAATGAGFTWSDASGAFAAVAENGYFISAASTPTLPASPNEGDTIAFVVDTASTCTITGNTGQKIRLGAALSASAGTCANNARGDTIELVYRSTGTTWFATSSVGTWMIT